MKKILVCALALMMIGSAALAEGKTYEGTVVSTGSEAVLAPAAGTVGKVLCQAGESVRAGDEIAALSTTTVYAEEAGTVTVFGAAGESVDTLSSRYGAVVYIEPDCLFTLTGNTSYAYDAEENKIIHPGETVYLKSTSSSSYTGVGMVTALNGSKYTVEVVSGNLLDSQLVYIYRDASFASTSRIGRGTTSRCDAVAVTGTGVVSELLVRDGAHVEPGTPLFTTVDASAYAYQMASGADGVVASVNVAPGDAVEAGTLIAEIYPDSAMRLELIVEGRDLRSFAVGSKAEITFDNGVTAEGTIERVSGVPYVPETTDEEDTDDTVYFAVYVAFTTDEAVPYGMAAKATIAE